MLMSAIGWGVLVVSCWIVVGMAVGVFVGAVIHGSGEEIALSSRSLRAQRLPMRRFGNRRSRSAVPHLN